MIRIQVEVTVGKARYRSGQDEQVGKDVGDVVVKDGEASVQNDPSGP